MIIVLGEKMSNTILLPKACRQIAEFFADEREGNTSLYKRRGGFKREDIVAGAMGEIAAYLWLQQKGYEVGNPDFTIHKKKSYGADLSDGEYFFHVKTQTTQSVEKYGESWILQKTDKLVSVPTAKHYLLLCVVHIDTGEVEIKSCVSGTILASKKAWGKPRLEWFQKTKVALYLADIKKKVGRLFTLRSR
jgi:hypothetical protein